MTSSYQQVFLILLQICDSASTVIQCFQIGKIETYDEEGYVAKRLNVIRWDKSDGSNKLVLAFWVKEIREIMATSHYSEVAKRLSNALSLSRTYMQLTEYTTYTYIYLGLHSTQ